MVRIPASWVTSSGWPTRLAISSEGASCWPGSRRSPRSPAPAARRRRRSRESWGSQWSSEASLSFLAAPWPAGTHTIYPATRESQVHTIYPPALATRPSRRADDAHGSPPAPTSSASSSRRASQLASRSTVASASGCSSTNSRSRSASQPSADLARRRAGPEFLDPAVGEVHRSPAVLGNTASTIAGLLHRVRLGRAGGRRRARRPRHSRSGGRAARAGAAPCTARRPCWPAPPAPRPPPPPPGTGPARRAICSAGSGYSRSSRTIAMSVGPSAAALRPGRSRSCRSTAAPGARAAGSVRRSVAEHRRNDPVVKSATGDVAAFSRSIDLGVNTISGLSRPDSACQRSRWK